MRWFSGILVVIITFTSSSLFAQSHDNAHIFYGIDLNHKVGDFGYSITNLVIGEIEGATTVPFEIKEDYHDNIEPEFLRLNFDIMTVAFLPSQANIATGVICMVEYDSDYNYHMYSGDKFDQSVALLKRRYGPPEEFHEKSQVFEYCTWETDYYQLMLGRNIEERSLTVIYWLKK